VTWPIIFPHAREIDEMLTFLAWTPLINSSPTFHRPFASPGLDLPRHERAGRGGALYPVHVGQSSQASEMTCFAGAGVYDHEVPAVVKMLAGRSEFVTAYTPYQPEVAQASCRPFRIPTLISRLSGLRSERVALRRGDRPRRGAQHGPRRDHSSEDGGLGRRASALARSRQDLRARHRSRHVEVPLKDG